METRKIALACFIGGVMCGAVALLFAPMYWWLGLLAGFAGGYISYEFRSVLRMVPVAFRRAKEEAGGSWKEFCGYLGEVMHAILSFARRPHPIALFSALCAAGLTAKICATAPIHNSYNAPFNSNEFESALFVTAFCFCLLWLVSFVLLGVCAVYGTVQDGVDWTHDITKVGKTNEEGGRTYILLTYSNCFRWILSAIGPFAFFFGWTLWKWVGILLFRFSWYLFKLIHSEKRLLCGVDGTLGGVASYIWLASSSHTLLGHAVLVLFGGLLGAALGIVNWEIVSKRILHVGEQAASA